MLKKVAVVAVCFALVLTTVWVGFSTSPPEVAAKGKQEERHYRAFWVNAFEPGLKTPQEIDQLVADVKAANMNAIVAQISRRHDAYYNSTYLPRTEDPAVPIGFDPLGYLIKKAKKHHIEVHAWVAVGPMWSTVYGGPPQNRNHIWHKHGPDAPDEDTWVTKGYDGSSGAYMQPYMDLGNPDAVEHLVKMVREIVRKYDVNAIHLDYIRYPENPGGKPNGWYGYNPTALQRFQLETGRTDRPEPSDPEWLQWKVRQVDQATQRIYLEIMKLNRKVHVTAAALSWGFADPRTSDWQKMDPVQRAHQDWKKWVQHGYLDYAFVMNYDPEADPRRSERFEQWIEWQKDMPRTRGIVIGPGIYLNSISDSIVQIKKSLAPSPAGNVAEGVSPYVYNVWSNDGKPQGDLIRSLSQPTAYNDGEPPFTKKVKPPVADWKKAKKGHVLGRIVDKRGQVVTSGTVELLKDGKRNHAVTVAIDGNGYFGATDLQPGKYTVRVNGVKLKQKIKVKQKKVAAVTLKIKKK
ncbi:family 10 glycosylhydrolase [Numidum massiliense]|uniref:family 10 glycosylhydrolase n=1 Tax=Numidum massiliense TaxID=1522315 RepID=UPI0006D54B8B|nr:family 10 glycosylhydrolase [Numidum massiliense]